MRETPSRRAWSPACTAHRAALLEPLLDPRQPCLQRVDVPRSDPHLRWTLLSRRVQATMWSDYICPWAYLGRDRTALLRSLGVSVTAMPYELHPDLPPQGRAVRPDGRMGRAYEAIGRECDDVGMPFRAPTHMPGTAGELWRRRRWCGCRPGGFEALDAALLRRTSSTVRTSAIRTSSIHSSRGAGALSRRADDGGQRCGAGSGRGVDQDGARPRHCRDPRMAVAGRLRAPWRSAS